MVRPLVIVLGAGASKEVGLPVGDELKFKIAEALNFKKDDFGRLQSGNREIAQAFEMEVRSNPNAGTLPDYFAAAKTISETMPLAISIDNFIYSHRDKPLVALVGKIAIAACIFQAERGSTLFIDPGNSYNKLDFSRTSATWFNGLFKQITQFCDANEIHTQLENLAIVSFNYDRCIKHFFREGLIAYYQMSAEDAAKAVSRIAFYHPYGSVGLLPFEIDASGAGKVEFGANRGGEGLITAAKQIKTFTEGVDEATSQIAEIRRHVVHASTLVFLGFAFHDLNLRLLYSDTTKPTSMGRVLGTAKGISDSNKNDVVDALCDLGGYRNEAVVLRQDLTAFLLVGEYSRQLSRGMK